MLSKNCTKIISYLVDNTTRKININQLSRILEISVGSVHKILKNLEKEDIVKSEPIGNSIIYHLNFDNSKTRNILEEINIYSNNIIKKKTKIIVTIAPKTNNPKMIQDFINAGMDVARINASHGTLESNQKIINTIRKVDNSIPILLDMPGSKIRLKDMDEEIHVKKGEIVIFTADDTPGKIPVDYENLHLDVKTGQRFLVDDGTIGFLIKKIEEKDIICETFNNGIIKSRKGLNFPNISFNKEDISAKDLKLIKFAVKNKLNFVGVSFVKDKKHINRIQKLINDPEIKIISKIETQKALDNYEEIIEESYGIMIDRGDLGSEISIEILPRLQKKIIDECNRRGKPVIIATQMLDSMTYKPYPLKAEISDVANAVLDGASTLMLSAETAIGDYPVETIKTMVAIIENIEEDVKPKIFINDGIMNESFADMIGKAITEITKETKINKILCITYGGYSARMISRYKLNVPIIAATSIEKVYQRLRILWGVEPLLICNGFDNSVSVEQKKEAVMKAIEEGLIDKKDTIIITAAVFPNNRKITNLLEIHKVDELLGFFNSKQE